MTSLVSSSGSVVERYLYDPYGDVTYLTSMWTPLSGSQYGWRYLFQGGRFDTTTSWYDFRNRDFIPAEGRWAERDHLGSQGSQQNLYEYLVSSPSDYSDPMGSEARKRQVYKPSIAGNWEYAVDRGEMMYGGFQIHVLKDGKEVAVVSGNGGFAELHRGKTLLKPSEFHKKYGDAAHKGAQAENQGGNQDRQESGMERKHSSAITRRR